MIIRRRIKIFDHLKHFLKKYTYPLIYLLLISLFLLCLELKYPYYFFQDDNRGLHFPLLIHNLRAMMSGEIPLYNFHQSLGIPHLSNGLSAVLYPITYIALFLSKLLFGHYFAGMDIQAIFHLIFGGLGLFFLLKELSLDDKSALFGALTYPLCSFNIFISNSWIIVGGPIGYFPWMIYLGIKLIGADARESFSRKYFLLLILARLMVAFIGHTQYFIYSVLLEIFTVTLFTLMFRHGKRVKQLLRPVSYYILSLVATAVLSLPLHLPMWRQMSISFSRGGAFDLGGLMEEGILISDWIQGLTWPFAFSSDPLAQSRDIVFIGIVPLIFIIVAFIAILTILIFRTREKTAQDPTPEKVALSAVVFLGLAVICFCWACNIIVPYLIQYIPILNRFRWPLSCNYF
jgi:hypothetical protein